MCAVSLLGAVLLAGCPPVDPPKPPVPPVDPCATFRCDVAGRTRCVVEEGLPRCACDEGLEDRGGLCLSPKPPDPCEPNPCTEPNRSVCRAVNSTAVCGCDEGYELEGGLCQPHMPITCDTTHTEGDPFEPDECPALARDIGTEGDQREPHTFFPASDNDWYRADARPEEIFAFRLEGPVAFRAETFFAMGDSSGGEVLEPLGTQRTATGLLDYAVKVKATGPGRVYLRARAGTFTETGAYEVSIRSLGLDDYGDEPETAIPAVLEDPHEGVLQFEGDADALRFEFGPSRSYRMQATLTDEEGNPLPVRVEVYALSSAPAWTLRRTMEGTLSGLDEVLHSANGGPQVLRISAGGSANAQRRGLRWTLQLTDLGTDDHPDGPAPTEASDVTVGVTATGTLERGDDVDAFRFEALASYVYRFRCIPPVGRDCLVRLIGPDGQQVAADLDGGEGDVFRKLLAPGTHVALISGSGSFSYTYSLENLGPDDHGDDFTRATSLGMPVVSVSGTASFQFPGDRDVLYVDWDPGHIYRITCTRVTASNCHVRVFDPQGLLLAQDTDGGDALLYLDYAQGGDTWIELQGSPGATGSVTWLIEDLEHDDHGNTLATGTAVLANNAWVAGLLQTPTDRDWFRFTPQSGRSYRVTCSALAPQTLTSCELRLYDLSENLLSQQPAGTQPMLTWTASSAAQLAIRITAPGGAMGSYLVKVEELP